MLEPARVATESLSSASISLITSEGILKFLVNESRDMHTRTDSPLAAKFIEELLARLKKRRDPLINTLILYLNDHESLQGDHPLILSTKAAAVKFGIEMMRRLFIRQELPDTSQSAASSSTAASPEPTSLHDRLRMSIGSVRDKSSQQEENADQFKKEFDNYARYHERSPILNKFFEALCTVQPTSTQNERNFSLASAVVTVKRTRLHSNKLHATCFLKNFFKNKDHDQKMRNML